MGSIVCFKGRNLTMDYCVFMDTTRFLPYCFSENQHNNHIHPVHFPRYSWQCLCLYHMQAEYYRLPELVKVLKQTSGHKVLAPISSSNSLSKSLSGTELCDRGGTITVGYRGTFAFGRDGLADVKFRKIVRLLVCGKVWMIRSVARSSLIHFACIGVASPRLCTAASWTVKGEQHQCRQIGSNMI